ncbi:PC4-domain-containing [Lecanosticta acicola]|uniref:PC4-domain-containing n=1 Tax=Lecanosticta acicola TaxID=111012 RepID=A0AAI9ECT7_9PEZI|nr:PC4-domain-containing [Lecanosticta acicola]
MSKATSRKRAAANDYESDGGFVEDAPKSKKSKGSNAKGAVDLQQKKDDDGNAYWDLSGTRRLGVSHYKGNTLINIREYYDKDGKMMPGRKGISITIDQFNAFLQVLPQVESVLAANDINVLRPQVDQQASSEAAGNEDEKEAAEDEDDQDAAAHETVSKKLDKFRHKQNHEATSDEDE